MPQPAAPTPNPAITPLVLDAELVDRPLQYPPAVRPRCACGKDGTLRSHGGRTCAEILVMRARIEGTGHRSRRGVALRVAGISLVVVTALAALAALAGLVVALVGAAAAVVAWLAAYWPALVAIAVALLLLGGGAKCAGLHCGGCRG